MGCGGKREREFVGGLRHLHAAAAAAGSRLHQHRKTDGFGDRHGVVVGADRALGARHHGNAELLHGFLGLDLVAHQADVLGLGSDEMQIGSARISAKRAFSDRKP